VARLRTVQASSGSAVTRGMVTAEVLCSAHWQGLTRGVVCCWLYMCTSRDDEEGVQVLDSVGSDTGHMTVMVQAETFWGMMCC